MAKKGDDGADRPQDPGKKLRKLIKGARAVMLTTMTPEGRFRSRPMKPGAFEEGALLFLTRAPAGKAEPDGQRVHLAYASPKQERYVSISGLASVVRDAGLVKELWEREHKAWFKEGKNDPQLAVLRVQVEHAEYWDGKSSRMVALPGPAPAPAPAPAKGGSEKAGSSA